MFKSSMTKEEAEAFIRSITGPKQRTIEGQEYKDTMLLLKLSTPFNQSNNQRTWTDEYRLGGKLYHVTYGLGNNPELTEVEDETLT